MVKDEKSCYCTGLNKTSQLTIELTILAIIISFGSILFSSTSLLQNIGPCSERFKCSSKQLKRYSLFASLLSASVTAYNLYQQQRKEEAEKCCKTLCKSCS